MFFSHFMLFPTCLEKKIWEYKTIISHLMFSSCFFVYAGNIEKCPFTYSILYSLLLIFYLNWGGGGGFLASEPVRGRSRATELPCYLCTSLLE